MNRGGPNSYSGNAVTSIMTGVQNYYVVGFGSSYDDITPVVVRSRPHLASNVTIIPTSADWPHFSTAEAKSPPIRFGFIPRFVPSFSTAAQLIFYGLFNDLNHKLYPTWFLQWVPSFNPTANATSPWWNIISQYTDANNKHPAANGECGAAVVGLFSAKLWRLHQLTRSLVAVTPCAGFDVIFDLNVKNGPQDTGTTTLTRVDVENIVQIASQTQPPAASRATTNDAIYVVIGGENIGYSDPLVGDFCTSMCAYHDVITLGSSNYLKYTFIGFPTCVASPRLITRLRPLPLGLRLICFRSLRLLAAFASFASGL